MFMKYFYAAFATCTAAVGIDPFVFVDRSNSQESCENACAILSSILTDRVSFPNSSIYDYEQNDYWSTRQSASLPACRVTPISAQDVSCTIRTLRSLSCQFAVKSGGHASFAGASNIMNAVTIDLSNLDQVTISRDRTQVSVGPGAIWSNVYATLDAHKIGVVGGRVVGIGVGGLTLGGGISYFSGRYGFACDNVINYEVVLADGSIQDINSTSNPDLYFALRGGGNNFGIVTRFDLASFSQGDMWGGTSRISPNDMSLAIRALVDFNINHEQDPNAAVYIAYAYAPIFNSSVAVIALEYGEPVENPPILQNFTNIPFIPESTLLKVANLTSLVNASEGSQPPGLRETYWTLTIQNDSEMMEDMVKIFEEEVASIQNATDVLPSLTLQPISPAMISHFSKNGGNALGITPDDGPLILANVCVSWADSTDDDRILKFAGTWTSRSTALAKRRHLLSKFIYQNYADISQDVFTGYGERNHRRLIDISRKYDPEGVFTKLQPGYFKIY